MISTIYSYYSPWGILWHHSFNEYAYCEQEKFLGKWCYYQKITFHRQGLRLQYRHVDVHLSYFTMTCFQQSHLHSHCHEDFKVSPAMGQYQKLKDWYQIPFQASWIPSTPSEYWHTSLWELWGLLVWRRSQVWTSASRLAIMLKVFVVFLCPYTQINEKVFNMDHCHLLVILPKVIFIVIVLLTSLTSGTKWVWMFYYCVPDGWILDKEQEY